MERFLIKMGRISTCSVLRDTVYTYNCIIIIIVSLFAYSWFRQQMRHASISVHIIEPGFFSTNLMDTDNVSNTMEKVWDRMSESQRNYYGRQCIDQRK